jgi:hypothetical protein
MKTLLLTLLLCLFVSHHSLGQTREDTEKWIAETLQANAQSYKVRQAHSHEKGTLSFLTFSDFSFQFEDGYFIIHCNASYPKYMGADAVDKVQMRLPLWDLKISSDAAEKAGEDTYNISFGTASAAFQYVNETGRYNEKKWAFLIRVPAEGNGELATRLKDAFNRLNRDYGNPLTIK